MIVASANQGNVRNGRKSSLSSSKSHRPCCETLVTSGAEVRVPGCSDLIPAFLYEPQCLSKLALAQAVVVGQLDAWLQPDLRLPVSTHCVYVEPLLLARKAEETKPSLTEDRRPHSGRLAFRSPILPEARTAYSSTCWLPSPEVGVEMMLAHCGRRAAQNTDSARRCTLPAAAQALPSCLLTTLPLQVT